MVIDGGKGQLAAAHAALRDHGIEDIVLISIAKSRSKGDTRSSERIFRLNAKSALTLKRGSKEFMLLTSIRDEAHRFAIEFHRKLRSKAANKLSTATSGTTSVAGGAGVVGGAAARSWRC